MPLLSCLYLKCGVQIDGQDGFDGGAFSLFDERGGHFIIKVIKLKFYSRLSTTE